MLMNIKLVFKGTPKMITSFSDLKVSSESGFGMIELVVV